MRHAIAPSGDVVDHASPALASIRDRLRRKRSKLRETLDGYVRGKDTSKYLQDQIVTERNGRFVLLVKAEHRASLPGLVHGSSSSGQTLYLEPLATVEINNEVVALEVEESEEVMRILLALTDAFRGRGTRTSRGPSTWPPSSTCCRPRRASRRSPAPWRRSCRTDGRLELLAARHPLLMTGVVSRYTDDVDGSAGGADTGRHQTRAPVHDAAHHRSEHRRQDRRAQDGGPAAR